MDQHGGHPDELDQLGERRFIFLALTQRIQIHPGEGREIAQDLAALRGEIRRGDPQHAQCEQKAADPVVQGGCPFDQGPVVGRQQQRKADIRALDLVQGALCQRVQPIARRREAWIDQT